MIELLPDIPPTLAAVLAELARQYLAGVSTPAVAVPEMDAERTARWIEALGRVYGAHPAARRYAWRLVGPVDGHDSRSVAFAVQRWVRDSLAYVREAGEQLALPPTTIADGFGDCDCHAAVVVMLLTALGVRSRVRVLYRRAADGWQRPFHVVAQALVGGEWLDLETTHPAVRLGESPEAFMRRSMTKL